MTQYLDDNGHRIVPHEEAHPDTSLDELMTALDMMIENTLALPGQITATHTTRWDLVEFMLLMRQILKSKTG